MRQRTVESGDGTQLAYFTLGDGPALLVVGGALATAADYFPLAQCLASEYAAHVLERRGRGASGPQGPGYGIATEIVDLQSVHDQTGAQRVFGHSYGGLIALETAKSIRGSRGSPCSSPAWPRTARSRPHGWSPTGGRWPQAIRAAPSHASSSTLGMGLRCSHGCRLCT